MTAPLTVEISPEAARLIASADITRQGMTSIQAREVIAFKRALRIALRDRNNAVAEILAMPRGSLDSLI